MRFYQTVQLKNGKECLLRSAEESDVEEFLACFRQCHGETDFLTTYPDESHLTLEREAAYVKSALESKTDVMILAILDGKIVGSAGINLLKDRDKLRHRADFGISVFKDCWGLGIGNAMTKACIDCAKQAGFLQLELEAVAENKSALNLYTKYGFVEYGRNPRGFLTREGRWQELVLMRLELF